MKNKYQEWTTNNNIKNMIISAVDYWACDSWTLKDFYSTFMILILSTLTSISWNELQNEWTTKWSTKFHFKSWTTKAKKSKWKKQWNNIKVSWDFLVRYLLSQSNEWIQFAVLCYAIQFSFFFLLLFGIKLVVSIKLSWFSSIEKAIKLNWHHLNPMIK